ncbi:MAG: hypothetical protein L6Q35_10490, partial [Phycisphaerales bacterium]|nr:hypothetical protein [Phycisphaerales bacterium]
SDPGHNEIIFLHRILPGRTDQSYGIHVARLAGLPRPVIERSREVLSSLAVQQDSGAIAAARSAPARVPPASAPQDGQMALFTEYLRHPAVDHLREIKIESLTPIQAFDELRRIKQLTDEC